MSEWWSYRPSDFLMFSPRIYWRLFESINEAFWPAQPVVIALGLAWLLRARPAPRLAAGVLAMASIVVAWAFLWQRFTPINWPAQYFALVFGLQGVLLMALAFGGGWQPTRSPAARRTGVGLIAWALLAHPLLAPAFGRPWTQAEVFGLAPDPTAIATLGWLLSVEGTHTARIGLLMSRVFAALWLAAAAAMLATMGSWQALVPLAALVATMAGLAAKRGR